MPVFASSFEIVTIPVSLLNTRDNYYSFENPDEIFASDIIRNFNSSYKVHSVDLYSLNAKLSNNPALKSQVSAALKKYERSRTIDYPAMKKLASEFNVNSILLVYATGENPKTSLKKDLWETLNILSAFNITQPVRIKAETVLLDNVNDIVMYSSVYEFDVSNSSNKFHAMNYAQASEHLLKIKKFSRDILSKAVCENVTLRFYPKTIRPIDVKPVGESIDAGLLKYNKNVPSFQKPEKPKSDEDEFNEKEYGEMIYGL